MAERRPDDVFAKNASVVHRCIQKRGDVDEKWHWGVYQEECLRAREAERMKDAEISRLRAALRPFAEFGRVYGPVASALDYPEDHILLEVGAERGPVVVRLSDLYSAVEALEGT